MSSSVDTPDSAIRSTFNLFESTTNVFPTSSLSIDHNFVNVCITDTRQNDVKLTCMKESNLEVMGKLLDKEIFSNI